MIILKPIPDYRIWGGTRLKQYVDTPYNKVGHLYSVLGKPEHSNVILNGIYAGKTFYEYFCNVKDQYGLSKYLYYPLTIALVDAKENLSIQVHPNSSKAQELEGIDLGKEESWYFLDTKADGYIFNGVHCDNVQQITSAIEEGSIEKILCKSPVRKGDYTCVKAGTLHAMTEGLFVYEIEYGSDYTYRFYDFNRIDINKNKRELHIIKALDCVNVSLKSEIIPCDEISTAILEENYCTQSLKDQENYLNQSETLECLTLIEGSCQIEDERLTGGMSIILEPGESIVGQDLKYAIVARCMTGDENE